MPYHELNGPIKTNKENNLQMLFTKQGLSRFCRLKTCKTCGKKKKRKKLLPEIKSAASGKRLRVLRVQVRRKNGALADSTPVSVLTSGGAIPNNKWH